MLFSTNKYIIQSGIFGEVKMERVYLAVKHLILLVLALGFVSCGDTIVLRLVRSSSMVRV